MKTRTKVCAALAAVLAVALAVIGLTWNASFVPDEATLPEKIRDFDNIGRETPLSTDVRVYDDVGIGSEAWYLIEIGEDLDLGYVKLERNFLGRYQIVHLGYGGGSFWDGIVESGGTYYWLLGGRDVSGRIASVSATVEGKTYTMENTTGDTHFLLCTELSSDWSPEEDHIDRETLRLYDEQGNDITADYDLSGGGIQ